jgi:serine/threonine-protein kinase
MGVVYQAVQTGTGRTVAIKYLHGGGSLDPALRSRFAGEAHALARIDHPNIVRVYDADEDDAGRPYFAMEFVPGGSIGRLIRSSPVDPREAARIVAAVASAVEAAHRVHVLHRDVKPGNVLLAADGTPKITDFGLAKLGDRDDGLTVSGAVMGTPSYMAPEQAAGHRLDFDPRIDVYGLGATLYELLTGKPPYKGPTNAATLKLVEKANLVPPTTHRPGLPRDLEAICLKCLARDPLDRYPTAQEVADDLNRYLDGQPTYARPATPWQKIHRRLRRHRVAFAILTLLALVGAGMAVAARERDPRRQLERALDRGDKVTLVGASGLPRHHRWEMDEVALTLPTAAGGAAGFQSQTRSQLELIHDSRTDRYRFTAELRHLSGGDADSRVGVYLGPTNGSGPHGMRISRWYGFEYTESPPPAMRRPGLTGYDLVTLHMRERSETSNAALGVFEFPPVRFVPTPWRKIVIDVTPDALAVYWRQDDGTLAEAYRRIAGAPDPAAEALRFQFDPARDPRGLVIPDWVPRGPLGIYVVNAGVAFKNVTLEPLPQAPSP